MLEMILKEFFSIIVTILIGIITNYIYDRLTR